MTAPGRAVFLSYASEDADPAARICAVLKAAGIEVWFDQSELRGGDAWDQSIRRQIKNCALFLPVVSRNTHERREGYFRLEWKLAVDRSHLMDAGMAFLLPVVIDDTRDDDERVPDRFREVQWTRLPGGETPPEFVERLKRLLSGDPPQEARTTQIERHLPTAPRAPASSRSKVVLVAAIALSVLALGYLVASRFVLSKHGPEVAAQGPAAQSAPASGFSPPPHSIAVLPFTNLSGDKGQEYFSDGLTEELLNSLTEINELQVAARTSAFSFKGTNADIGTIARKLNVGAVLEGSVRRSGRTIRITTQLIDAVTGFRLWSKTYDRDLKDVLHLQTEIATSVASALKVALLSDTSAKIELGGTRIPAAFDAYLRAEKAMSSVRDAKEFAAAITVYTEAIRLDPSYALAFAGRSRAFTADASYAVGEAAVRDGKAKALADARQALALAPDLGRAHLALANYFEYALDFAQANDEYERALALAPGDARVLRHVGMFATFMGHFEVGIAAARRAVTLDGLARNSYLALGQALYSARSYEEAVAAYAEAISLNAEPSAVHGLAYYELGEFERARAICETATEDADSLQCRAVVYGKLGRRADAEAVLSKMKKEYGDAAAYQYATIYAQWGDRAQALEWLDTAWRLRDVELLGLKTDALIDPLRKDPQFQAIERQLRFPR